MAVPYLETEIDISTFLNRGRLPDSYLKINLFEKYLANILTEKTDLRFSLHRKFRKTILITFALKKKPARVEENRLERGRISKRKSIEFLSSIILPK